MVLKVVTPQQEVRVCGNHVLADFTQLGMGLAGERKTCLPRYPDNSLIAFCGNTEILVLFTS